jgi:hypothetical protein
MSAIKKAAGLVIGVSAVGAIGVAIAQGQPPNPYVSNPALGAGEQTVHLTPIGETGVLAWTGEYQQTATLTKQDEQAAVASQPAEQVAQAPAPAPAPEPQAAPAPAPAPTNELGAGPEPAPLAPKHDRG